MRLFTELNKNIMLFYKTNITLVNGILAIYKKRFVRKTFVKVYFLQQAAGCNYSGSSLRPYQI